MTAGVTTPRSSDTMRRFSKKKFLLLYSFSYVCVGFGVALAALAAFVAWELRTSSPMLDAGCSASAASVGRASSIALVFFSLFGAIFFLTMYLQEVMDYGALGRQTSGSPPIAAGLVLGGPLSAKLAGRLGTRNVVAGGLHRGGRGRLLLLSGAGPDTGYGLIAVSLVLMGLGMGATMAPGH